MDYCVACAGTGWFFNDVCPLCDLNDIPRDEVAAGTDAWGAWEEPESRSTDIEVDANPTERESSSVDALSEAPPILEIPSLEDVPIAPPENIQSETQEVEDSEMRGGLFMLSGGFFQLTVLVPVISRPSLSEAEVEKIGTTWTHGSVDGVPSFAPRAVDTAEMWQEASQQAQHESCGICMQSFDEGDKLTALPCASRGCGSVWHLSCIHKWLNQGSTASCPLCRDEIDCGAGPASVSPTFSTLTVLGNSQGRSSNRLSQDLVGVLFQALVSQQLSSTPQGLVPALMAPPSLMEVEDDLSSSREPHVALA